MVVAEYTVRSMSPKQRNCSKGVSFHQRPVRRTNSGQTRGIRPEAGIVDPSKQVGPSNYSRGTSFSRRPVRRLSLQRSFRNRRTFWLLMYCTEYFLLEYRTGWYHQIYYIFHSETGWLTGHTMLWRYL